MKLILRCIPVILSALYVSSASLQAQNLIVIRHGEAVHNVERIYNSDQENSENYPLTERGKDQIREAARKLREEYSIDDTKVSKVFYSPLRRTKESADVLVQSLKIDENKMVVEPLIREIGMGSLEGLSVLRGQIYFIWGGFNHSLAKRYGGETDEEVRSRARTFLERVRTYPYKHDVIVVTHAATATELISLCNTPKSWWWAGIENAGFRVIQLD